MLGIADRQLLVGLATAALDRDPGSALRLIARAADRGVDLGQLGRSFLGFLRDLEVVASVKPAPGVELADLIDATPEEIDEVKGLAERAGAGLTTVLFDRWARAVDEASRLPVPRLLYEMAAIDLCAAEPLVPLGDLLQRLDELEGRLRGTRPAAAGATGGGSAPAPGPAAPKSKPAPAGPRAWGAPPSRAEPPRRLRPSPPRWLPSRRRGRARASAAAPTVAAKVAPAPREPPCRRRPAPTRPGAASWRSSRRRACRWARCSPTPTSSPWSLAR